MPSHWVRPAIKRRNDETADVFESQRTPHRPQHVVWQQNCTATLCTADQPEAGRTWRALHLTSGPCLKDSQSTAFRQLVLVKALRVGAYATTATFTTATVTVPPEWLTVILRLIRTWLWFIDGSRRVPINGRTFGRWPVLLGSSCRLCHCLITRRLLRPDCQNLRLEGQLPLPRTPSVRQSVSAREVRVKICGACDIDAEHNLLSIRTRYPTYVLHCASQRATCKSSAKHCRPRGTDPVTGLT